MAGYTKLFNSIVTSTIWLEADHVRIVWITMLALSNKHGLVEGSAPGLARLSGVSLDRCLEAIRVLSSPDEHSRSKTLDGRRIVEVDGGWQLVNHAHYRALMSGDDKREYFRQKKAEQRERERKEKTPPAPTSDNHNGFDAFWSSYPKKVAKAQALKAWKKIKPEEHDAISAALVRHKRCEQWQKNNGEFIPHPASWLNGRRWEDEVTVPRPRTLGPDYSSSMDWFDECKSIHAGECSQRSHHENRKLREQA